MERAVVFHADDGYALHGTLYGDAAAGSGVLVAPAMGVPQRFYADFARWLAAQGHAVLTFDYRGIGASRPDAPLRTLHADVLTWAEQDAAAALRCLDAQLPADAPIHWLGHSLGGQILGLVPGRERVARMVTVGCGSGYWLQNTWTARLYVWWLWFVVVPLVLPLAGYFPGRRLRKVGDLPRGVMAQWRRWCLAPEYLLRDDTAARRARYAALTAPILSLAFTDDEYMSKRNVDAIHAFYAGAPRTMRRIAPRDVGVRRIGHFGFFRARFEPTLWPLAARFLTQESTP